jgi:hypothetical protein
VEGAGAAGNVGQAWKTGFEAASGRRVTGQNHLQVAALAAV